jgi:site-specific recombinase XerD
MGSHTTKLIVDYLENVRPHFVTNVTGDILFPCAFKGTRMGTHALKYVIDKYAERAGFTKRVTPHLFRHSAASHILHNAGENCLRELQEFLGHEDLSTTGIYLHTSIPRLKKLFSEAHPLERDVA